MVPRPPRRWLPRRPRSILGWLKLGAAAGGLVVLGLVALFGIWTLLLVTTLPLDPPQPRAEQGPSLVLTTAAGQPIATRGPAYGEPIAVDGIPRHLVDALLAIEDRRFYGHFGIDLRGMARAALVNLRAGEVRQGASTLTQQLVKNVYLTPERSFRRKVQEVAIALWLETRLSKDEILARYLNTVYFGAGAYGVDAASRRYFNKPAREVTVAEAAMLAGLIRAPSQYNPSRSLELARERAATVLDAMVETGALDPVAAAAAKAAPAAPAIAPETPPGWGYYADWASQEVRERLGPSAVGSFRIATAFDPELQAIAEKVVAQALSGEGAQKNVGEAALVAMRHDGAVVAMVGGRDYPRSQFNRATQAKRQPGSLFKLFVYLAALQRGVPLSTILSDQRMSVEGWSPDNYDGRFRGPVDLRSAFAQSINTVAVQLAERAGRGQVVRIARELGVSSPLPEVPSLALGTAETTMMEMMRAYGAVAANSASVTPYAIQRIESPDRVAYARPAAAVPPPSWPRQPMLDLMLGVVRNGTGRAAALNRPVAGKTGTTSDYRDAWFIGFTADAVVGVWVGNDDNSPMREVTGGQLPARIWRDFMVQADAVKAGEAPVPAPLPPPAATAQDRPQGILRWLFGGDEPAPRRAPAPRRNESAGPAWEHGPQGGNN